MLSVIEALREAKERLEKAGVVRADWDASWLLANALGVDRVTLYLEPGRDLTRGQVSLFRDLVRRRCAREPLQYILGTQGFMGLELAVDARVLIPRPETEVLVEEVLSWLKTWPTAGHSSPGHSSPGHGSPGHPRRDEVSVAGTEEIPVVDVGTGSGAIAVALAVLNRQVLAYATDLSAGALVVAAENARRQGVTGRVRLLAGDLLEPLRGLGLDGRMAAVVSNPPYIPAGDIPGLQPEVRDYEPRLALAGGPDGLNPYRKLAPAAGDLLAPGGLLAVEVGAGQAEAVAGIFESNGFARTRIVPDLAGIDRVVTAVWRE